MKRFPRQLALFLCIPALGVLAVPVSPLPYKVAFVIPDAVQLSELSRVRVDGWLGNRIDANEKSRLLVVDTVPLLAGYIKKPGEQEWIGEHVGKWIDAATLAWAYSGDAELRAKIDPVVEQLISTQEPDGYLGTYAPDQRFGLYKGADWDVWSHAYNMIGLLTYYRYTGNEHALAAVRKMGDLLIATFPAKKSILSAGTHVGMAATSVLEPVVELYRVTGDERYLDFARYIVKSYDEPGGPAIVRSLLAGKGVDQTANGKAYEMLANLMGICDMARVTGDRDLLLAVTNAWSDIVRNRLYPTGAASMFEHFPRDHVLPNSAADDICETCVTTTWIQLNLKLLEVTGKPEYANEIERSLYNHLAAAQNPKGDDWCYYTPLEGLKKYDKGITCCHSSGPRAMALAPTAAYLQGDHVLYVDTFETSHASFSVDGHEVALGLDSGFPRQGGATLTIRSDGGAFFALRIRVPDWAAPLHINGRDYGAGWAEIPERGWKDGEQVRFTYNLSGRVIPGEYANFSRAAFGWGPFILAADISRNGKMESPESLLMDSRFAPTIADASGDLQFSARARGPWDKDDVPVSLVPFADAGSSGGRYSVWLRAAN
jgi:DUF1680 family protein